MAGKKHTGLEIAKKMLDEAIARTIQAQHLSLHHDSANMEVDESLAEALPHLSRASMKLEALIGDRE